MKVLCLVVISFILASCASENLKAPCPNYGKWCSQKSVNTWKK
jgi:hypothetical protein